MTYITIFHSSIAASNGGMRCCPCVLQHSWDVSLLVKNARMVANLDSMKAEFVAENSHDVTAHVVNLDSDYGQL